MPIHTSWKPMVQSMGKQYKGKKKCREFSDGKNVCVSEKAWSIFFATVTKNYSKGAEEKPRPKKTVEEADNLIEWYLRRIKNGTN